MERQRHSLQTSWLENDCWSPSQLHRLDWSSWKNMHQFRKNLKLYLIHSPFSSEPLQFECWETWWAINSIFLLLLIKKKKWFDLNRLKWLKTGISTCIYKRCGLQKGRAARRKTLHSHPALSVVNPRITKNFSTPINYRQISLPIELHLAPNILGSKKEKTPRPCEAQNHDDMERLTMSVSNSLPFFIWLAAYEIMGNFFH